MKKNNFHIIIIGPQGSGKGTQAEFLVKRLALKQIEMGKLLRKIASQKTALGRKINRLINEKGRLVPSSFVNKVLLAELRRIPKNKGFVIDGYPRNLAQARALEKILKKLGRSLTHVIYIPINRQTSIKRLALRRTCRECGKIFISGVNLGKKAKKCPACGGVIFQRLDDRPRAIVNRLKIFNENTKPVIDFYRKKGRLWRVDGEPPIKIVSKNLLKFF